MVLLRSPTAFDDDPVILGELVYLRAPAMSDYPAWAEIRRQSRDFLTPWEPLWPRDDLTRGAYRRRLRRYNRDMREDLAYPLYIFSNADDTLIGGITVSNIRRGVAQAASVGYWIGVPFARQGFMSSAMRACIPFVFDTLRLHRLEAACLPVNTASIALLRKCGFSEEGYARRYLQIGGRWQDHVLFAMLSDDPRP